MRCSIQAEDIARFGERHEKWQAYRIALGNEVRVTMYVYGHVVGGL